MVKKGASFVVRRYGDEHYSTIFNPNTGFFARVEDKGHPEPFWSEHGPELLDISITNWCDMGCPICYRSSDEHGEHMTLENYEVVMRQAKRMHVHQVALGGGNPNQHPQFPEILRLTREKYGIVPNYTTNGRGLDESVLEATSRYCGAVAISAYKPYLETETAIKKLQAWGVKVNIHFILSSKSINTAIEWLKNPPSFLAGINALIFLNYKPVGRYSSEALLLKHSNRVGEFFRLATEQRHPFRIGFDTCTVTGLARYADVPDVCYEGCDAGRFSMFVSENMEMYPCSFMTKDHKGTPIAGDNMHEYWREGEAFKRIRGTLSSAGCSSCQQRSLCLGGCPIWPEINLCPAPIESEGLEYLPVI